MRYIQYSMHRKSGNLWCVPAPSIPVMFSEYKYRMPAGQIKYIVSSSLLTTLSPSLTHTLPLVLTHTYSSSHPFSHTPSPCLLHTHFLFLSHTLSLPLFFYYSLEWLVKEMVRDVFIYSISSFQVLMLR